MSSDELQIETVAIDSLVLDDRNARTHNDRNLHAIADSLERFGQRKPIVVSLSNMVVAGNGTVEAARDILGWTSIQAVRFQTDDVQEIRAFAIADNRTAELAEWDDAILTETLQEFDSLAGTGFTAKELNQLVKVQEEPEHEYTRKVNIPLYEPTMDSPPPLDTLTDMTKTEELRQHIEADDQLSEQERSFLLTAAERHTRFNYAKIAEYYAHAPRHVQELMEESALVIIDIDSAIRNGYVTLTETLDSILGEELSGEDARA